MSYPTMSLRRFPPRAENLHAVDLVLAFIATMFVDYEGIVDKFRAVHSWTPDTVDGMGIARIFRAERAIEDDIDVKVVIVNRGFSGRGA